MSDSRQDFIDSWLTEMPVGVGKIGHGFFSPAPRDATPRIYFSTTGLIMFEVDPEQLPNGYKRIIGSQTAFYWHETDGEIDIACELSVAPQSLTVNAIGKPAESKMHASDLYNVVLQNTNVSIRFMSDKKLSDSGYDLWKRLLSIGHTVSVYDSSAPGNSLITMKTVDDLDRFYRAGDNSYERYQFVLSESGMMLAETRSFFNTRRMRELSGLL